MKFALLLLICSVTVASADITKEEVIRQLRDLVSQQGEQLERAETNADRAVGELGKARVQVDKVATERDGWESYGKEQHEFFMNAELRVAKEQAAVLRRNIIIAGLFVAIGIYAFLKFYLRIPFL